MNRLQDWLDEKQMTQAEFAEAFGMRAETINRIANGKQEPGARFMWRFFERYGKDATLAVFNEAQQ
jgi:transcriptional regulator with XRE-family HTH domain